MSQDLNDTIDCVERTLTVRPPVSRAPVWFIETHPDELERIVANALETAAALDATGALTASRSIPPALQGLITTSSVDSDGGRLLNISEVAKQLRVTRVTVYTWIE